MTTSNLMNGLTALSFDVGEAARTINMFVPDTAYYVTNQHGTSWNRAPGDVKPSWKWNTAQRTGTDYQRKEYRQALSQVNYYMKSTARGMVLFSRITKWWQFEGWMITETCSFQIQFRGTSEAQPHNRS